MYLSTFNCLKITIIVSFIIKMSYDLRQQIFNKNIELEVIFYKNIKLQILWFNAFKFSIVCS